MPDKLKNPLLVKLKDWPKGDQDAWCMALRQGDVMEPGGPASELRPASITWMVNSYGRWVGWAQKEGLLGAGAAALDVISRETVARYIADTRRVNGSSTVADRIQKLSLMARAMRPDADWEWLRIIYRKLARVAVPARDKRSKLVNADELYRFGIELIKEGEVLAQSDRLHGAIRCRDGLIIALLISRPILRRKNLQALKLGESLVKRGADFALQISPSHMKQKRAVDALLPQELTPLLQRYLQYHRPYLFPRNRNSRQPFTHDPNTYRHVWVSQCGRGMAAETIYGRFVQLTRAKFGRSVNPHLCRDIAVTSYALEDPENVRSSTHIIGHADYRTTERAYNLARSFEATQRHQTNILEIRTAMTEKRLEGLSA